MLVSGRVFRVPGRRTKLEKNTFLGWSTGGCFSRAYPEFKKPLGAMRFVIFGSVTKSPKWQLSSDQNRCCIEGTIQPSHLGMVIGHYKNPYYTGIIISHEIRIPS